MKLLIGIITFTLFTLNCNAQSDSVYYLNKTMEKLKSGDCDVARKFYNVYKEVYNNNNPVSSIEVLLDECSKKDTFAVGETMMVDGEKYIVAYTRDGGRHGSAVKDCGYHHLFFCCYYEDNSLKYVSRKKIPTFEELNMIYRNRDAIRFYDVYWTCTKEDGTDISFKVIDFSTGKSYSVKGTYDTAKILLIHRF